VGVVCGRQPGPDIEELPDSDLPDQILDDPPEKGAVRAGDVDDARVDSAELVAGQPVDLVVILAAEPVIPDPGRMRNGDVDARSCGILGHATLLRLCTSSPLNIVKPRQLQNTVAQLLSSTECRKISA